MVDNHDNNQTPQVAQPDSSATQRRIGHYDIVRKLLVGFILISLLNMAISHLFYTPKMQQIASENRELMFKYNILQDRIHTLQAKVEEIRHRDHHVYRSLFSVDTLTIRGTYTPYPESKYAYLMEDARYGELMRSTWMTMDALTRTIYAESCSLDELQRLAKNKESMSLAIPAIWPIDRTQLKAFYAFGLRQHPIFKIRRMHRGVDMSTDFGVPVYATGDGIVEKVEQGKRRRGYGRQVLINHEFGYKTRYAHLQKMFVKPGERVTRGQLIGEVGSTGGSTGPHLHYEVIHMGKHVNPVNYFNRNMTADEYRRLMENIKYNSDLETFEGNGND